VTRGWLALILLLTVLGSANPGWAQAGGGGLDLDTGADSISRFASARWSQIRPNRDFDGGCVVGFLAFKFSPTGYFIFNNHVRGSWLVDELGNLKLRSRTGEVVTMVVEGNTLRPTRTVSFVRRTDLFQRCPSGVL
jgi:hypothetical protein